MSEAEVSVIEGPTFGRALRVQLPEGGGVYIEALNHPGDADMYLREPELRAWLIQRAEEAARQWKQREEST